MIEICILFINIIDLHKHKQKQRSHVSHLEFQDGRQRLKIENCPIAFVDPKNIYLYTKIMFLCHLETEISKFWYFVTP